MKLPNVIATAIGQCVRTASHRPGCANTTHAHTMYTAAVQQTQIQSRDPLRCVTFTAAPARSRPDDHGVARCRTMPAICVATTTNVTPAKTSTTGTTRFDST